MTTQDPDQAPPSRTAPDLARPTTAGPAAAAQPAASNGHRLSGLLPGRPYRLSPPEDRDETVRQVRAHFGLDDFWDPV